VVTESVLKAKQSKAKQRCVMGVTVDSPDNLGVAGLAVDGGGHKKQ